MKAEPTTKALIEMLYERIPELFDRPKREWVGLTKDEVEILSYKAAGNTWTAIELANAKLKEKNFD
jgi:hypothetical protein